MACLQMVSVQSTLSLDNRLDAKGKEQALTSDPPASPLQCWDYGCTPPCPDPRSMSDIYFKDIAGANESPIYNICSVIEPVTVAVRWSIIRHSTDNSSVCVV